jgi:hypothetical protein
MEQSNGGDIRRLHIGSLADTMADRSMRFGSAGKQEPLFRIAELRASHHKFDKFRSFVGR